ncbi:hypothetical protein NC652_022827 [Populus alba x Populus x berolinensis]|nr:hypothetical protein NC652_022827 [Populus alba x Populus x berolinensis]
MHSVVTGIVNFMLFSVDFLWDYIWLLCNDIKDRRRRFWWPFSSPPRRALCFYHSIPAIVDSSVQPGPLLIGLIHQSGCFCLSIFKQCSYSVNHIYKAPLLMPREQ